MTLPLAIAGAALVAAFGSPAGAPQDLDVTIQVEGTPGPGVPAAIKFTLVNRGKTTVNVLDWYTPLEGMRGDLFDVTRDGKALPYRGILGKRGDPDKASYRALAPGARLEATVPLAEGYEVAASGAYAVTFDWRGRGDVSPEGVPIPRPREAHQGPRIRSNTVTFAVAP